MDSSCSTVPATWGGRTTAIGVIHDERAGTVTAVLSAQAEGFCLSGPDDQDSMLAGWGGALGAVRPGTDPGGQGVLAGVGEPDRGGGTSSVPGGARPRRSSRRTQSWPTTSPTSTRKAATTVAHEMLLSVTVDQRRVRRRRTVTALDAAVEVLADELRLFAGRLGGAGISGWHP